MTPVLLAADSIQAPSISYSGLLPVLIVLGAACVGVLVEAFVPRGSAHADNAAMTVAALGRSDARSWKSNTC